MKEGSNDRTTCAWGVHYFVISTIVLVVVLLYSSTVAYFGLPGERVPPLPISLAQHIEEEGVDVVVERLVVEK